MSFTPPAHDCALCPRLNEFLAEHRAREPSWHNAPVLSFGPIEAELLIVGLAPGLQGANKTGRPFTGDYAGDLLYKTLSERGFTNGNYGRRADDGMTVTGVRITNAVRCVPPQNKPIGSEVANCLPFLNAEIANMENLKVILCLGQLSHNATLKAMGIKQSAYKFSHNVTHELPDRAFHMVNSYHCSRYNTNTGRLTVDMFNDVFDTIDLHLGRSN